MNKQKYLKPWIFGVTLGLIIVLSEVLLRIHPPSAYVFCLAGHTRDLVNTIINHIADTRYPQTFLSRKFLLLTSPAVFFGAWLAARFHNERANQPARQKTGSFLRGFMVMLIGIAIFGCPVRIVVRAGYGDWYGVAALCGLGIGITIATLYMRFKISRSN